MMGLRTLPDIEPVDVSDKVRDVMLMTVPGLKDEEDDPIVEPDVPMTDDGCERVFAKAYIHDEIPWMDLRHEVRDLMILAVPELDLPVDEASVIDADLPDDGMEAYIAGLSARRVRGMVARAALAASEVRAILSASAQPAMISMPLGEAAPVAAIAGAQTMLSIAASAPAPMIGAPEAVMRIPAPVAAEEIITVNDSDPEEVMETSEDPDVTGSRPAVLFSFGSQEVQRRGWRVCFSF